MGEGSNQSSHEKECNSLDFDEGDLYLKFSEHHLANNFPLKMPT